jgi:hypothetical protein
MGESTYAFFTPRAIHGFEDFILEFRGEGANIVNLAKMVVGQMQYLFLGSGADHKITIIADTPADQLSIFIYVHGLFLLYLRFPLLSSRTIGSIPPPNGKKILASSQVP